MDAIFSSAILLIIVVIAQSPAVAQSYTFVDDDFGPNMTFPNSSNHTGVVVGFYTIVPGFIAQSCYVGAGPKKFSFNYIGAASTTCTDINSGGMIVGRYIPAPSGNNQGFTYQNGNFVSVTVPGSESTSIDAIADDGTLAGSYLDTSGLAHAFIDRAGKFTTFEIAGTYNPDIVGINNKGQYVVTSFDVNRVQHSYLSFSPYFIELKVPGSAITVAYRINNNGKVALTWEDSVGVYHGGVYDLYLEKYFQVDHPGASGTTVQAIDDNDGLVGNYTLPNIRYGHAFIARGTVP